MERYGGTQAMAVEAEWTVAGGVAGLEESTWPLGLGGGPVAYPERPDEPDCIYYLRTGFCGYGNRCRFNHPRDRSVVMGSLGASGVEYPERVGQPVCQYYMRTGMCKFGASCKYHHPRQGVGSSAAIPLNVYGYPLRPGEKECSYYIKTGQCKFGITCKFHHPQPSGAQVPPPNNPNPGPSHLSVYPTMQSPAQSSQQYGVLPGNWPVARPAMIPGSYVPGSYGPMLFPPGIVPIPGWTPYPAPVNPAASPGSQPTVGAGSMYGLTQLPPPGTAYSVPYLSSPSAGPSSSNQKENAFPERPGQPECQYYLRTGDCKFGSTCKYHHPPELSVARPSFLLSPMGLPLRPGAPLCSHYAQNGVCRFGPSCKFDHPMGSLSYSPSASSLTDMPVAPYPVGSTIATFAPSSSSSDLRPELLTGMFSTTSFSKGGGGTTLQSSIQYSGQGSASSSGSGSSSSSTSVGGEPLTSR
ncbi:zinc finger CCCH domain-containing protein 32-like [Andrographis paniculata]|uniref:zinc finger CCCH domain-containing protein 32-like n=1 Tax=Andrographis paniculata TaxID=175694 RepID=UPI0021E95E12|nr:zinc finger CCCH domain-containing protein 32-like [Andrographis paniculata]